MDFRQLRYFVAVADTGTFSGAAERIRIAQPALSRAVARLEDEIGKPLFVRHASGVTLTDIGSALHRRAEGLLRDLRRLQDDIAADEGEPLGLTVVGMQPSLWALVTAPVLTDYLQRYKRASVRLMSGISASLHDAVDDGRADIAVVSALAIASSLQYVPLVTERIVAVAPAARRLRMSRPVSIAELARAPLVISQRPNIVRAKLDEAIARSGAAVDIRCEHDNADIMAALVAAGIGLTAAPYSVARQAQANHAISMAPLEDLTMSWRICFSKSRAGSNAIRILTTMLRQQAAQAIRSGAWKTATLDAE
ncbi:LysR family transcriptional regulator [Reyranella sp. CPCC 100927]|uniref:LysR family transcriptional regulator n=1 Tax=Reyranella sp. CPCC 100927 TaxID=2599616 RepID=UPI0015B78DE8|nr:LysR family transcriptional regulator [Reyranella sp. CPCC 100927]